MIRVTVELVSAVHPSRSRILGTAILCNDGVVSAENSRLGRYTFSIRGQGGKVMKEGVIENYPRLRVHPWNLITRMLTLGGYTK